MTESNVVFHLEICAGIRCLLDALYKKPVDDMLVRVWLFKINHMISPERFADFLFWEGEFARFIGMRDGRLIDVDEEPPGKWEFSHTPNTRPIDLLYKLIPEIRTLEEFPKTKVANRILKWDFPPAPTKPAPAKTQIVERWEDLTIYVPRREDLLSGDVQYSYAGRKPLHVHRKQLKLSPAGYELLDAILRGDANRRPKLSSEDSRRTLLNSIRNCLREYFGPQEDPIARGGAGTVFKVREYPSKSVYLDKALEHDDQISAKAYDPYDTEQDGTAF